MAKEMILVDKNKFNDDSHSVSNKAELKVQDETFWGNVPDMLKSKAKHWIHFLKKNFSDILDWNSNGDIFINGTEYTGTNMASLIKNIIRLTQNSSQPTLGDLLLIIVKSLVCDSKPQTGNGGINHASPKPILSQREKYVYDTQLGDGGVSHDVTTEDAALVFKPHNRSRKHRKLQTVNYTGPPGEKINKRDKPTKRLKSKWLAY